MQQFRKFCLIGFLGFGVDSLFFLCFTEITQHIMLARLLSFWLAASATWLGHRFYTYKNLIFTTIGAQWGKHMLTAHLSGGINLMVFWSIKAVVFLPIAFIVGILAGLLFNYFFTKNFVFTLHSNK